jgi:hypothetical protein
MVVFGRLARVSTCEEGFVSAGRRTRGFGDRLFYLPINEDEPQEGRAEVANSAGSGGGTRIKEKKLPGS